MLPARLDLPVPGSYHRDFTRHPPGPIQPQRCCSSVVGRLEEIHFYLNDFAVLLVHDLPATVFALVFPENKEECMEEEWHNCK